MKRSTDRIITTHAGSLSRPPDLIALNRARAQGEKVDASAYAQCLASAVADVVRRQQEIGIDIPDDGEFGKPMASNYDYGVWWNYAFARMEGFTPADQVPESQHKKSSVAEMALTTVGNRRDFQKFGEFYQDPESSGTLLGSAARRGGRRPVCTGPLKYTGQAAIAADIANLKKAMAAAGAEEGFMCAIGPGSFARGEDLYYKTEEEFVFAAADAMHEEFKAIVDAGLILQIDDPSLPDNWDMINPEPPLAEFKKFEAVRIDALNHALRGLPPDRIRFHICWGSWHGPHTTDIPLRDIVDLVLKVNAGRLFRGSGQRPSRARMAGLERGQAAARQAAHSGCGQSRHQHRGASAGGRGPHCALRRRRRPGECHRRFRLRLRRPHPSAARLGQAPGFGRGSEARHEGTVGLSRGATLPGLPRARVNLVSRHRCAPGGRETAMAMPANDIERLIRASIPDAEVTIRDLAGDGDHYAATVIAESFRGKSRVQQHQIVYAALKGEMGGKLHALALQTGIPEG